MPRTMQVSNPSYFVAYIYKWKMKQEIKSVEQRGYARKVFYPEVPHTFEDMKQAIYSYLDSKGKPTWYGVVAELIDWGGTVREEYVYWPDQQTFMENVAKTVSDVKK